MPSELDNYLFDLRGYLIFNGAVDAAHLAALNATLDQYRDLEPQQWRNNVQRADNFHANGIELQNIVEAGDAFERLIDHPAWIEHMREYCGERGTFVDGLFIDECFATIRATGGFLPVHSGGHEAIVRTQYRYTRGKFHCGQVNVLVALNDIGPGDGATMVIPGSHHSSLEHPAFKGSFMERGAMDVVEGAVEMHLKAGDALLFVDGLAHGSATRVNPGERRVAIYRYGGSWGATRRGYVYSDALLARLTPERRRILQPIAPLRAPAEAMAGR
jgi:ectoine hydroxylase-related dioxygenase (phytanoyl-CoA dioxygenase family)